MLICKAHWEIGRPFSNRLFLPCHSRPINHWGSHTCGSVTNKGLESKQGDNWLGGRVKQHLPPLCHLSANVCPFQNSSWIFVHWVICSSALKVYYANDQICKPRGLEQIKISIGKKSNITSFLFLCPLVR